ncbi:MAG TPA: hypothetical protein VF929_07975 [Gemmatimonadaceae bacterium]
MVARRGLPPYGGAIAFEVEPVEQWLEVEVGVTAIHSQHGLGITAGLLIGR